MLVVKLEGCHFSTRHLALLALIFMSKEIPRDFYNSVELHFSLLNRSHLTQKGKACLKCGLPLPGKGFLSLLVHRVGSTDSQATLFSHKQYSETGLYKGGKQGLES